MRKCDINAISPITCFTVPIIGQTTLNLTDEEIYKCLCSKAEVVEVLPNGKRRTLNFANYLTEAEYTPPVHIKAVEEPTKVVEEESVKTEPVTENTDKVIPSVVTEPIKVVEEESTEPSPVKTHEVSSRNNNNNRQNNNKQRKNKNNNNKR